MSAQADRPFSGGAPARAKASGGDQFGHWVTFALSGVTQKMRWIPPGRFLMGSPENEPQRADCEGPQHEVHISRGFWLFDTPVTQSIWAEVHGAQLGAFDDPDLPVTSVNWNDAVAFMARINALLPGLDLTLPTEAQWEYACRAGTTGSTNARDGETLDDIAWFNGNTTRIRPVALRRCNAWGLYDMLGNVWEWCADDLRTYEAASAVDPVGPSGGGRRALRGGSWVHFAHIVRSAHRYSFATDQGVSNAGFRCARRG